MSITLIKGLSGEKGPHDYQSRACEFIRIFMELHARRKYNVKVLPGANPFLEARARAEQRGFISRCASSRRERALSSPRLIYIYTRGVFIMHFYNLSSGREGWLYDRAGLPLPRYILFLSYSKGLSWSALSFRPGSNCN